MEMLPVTSKAIKAVAYDPSTAILAVQFPDDDVYHFSGVEPEIYTNLLQAPSIGAYFNANVRQKYAGTLVPHTPKES